MKNASLIFLSFFLAFIEVKAQDSLNRKGMESAFEQALSVGSSFPVMATEPGLFPGPEVHWQGEYGLSEHFSATIDLGYIYHPEVEFNNSYPQKPLIPLTLGGKAYYHPRGKSDGNFHIALNTGSFFIPWKGSLSPKWGFSLDLGRTSSGPLEYGLTYRSFLNSFVQYRAIATYLGYRF